MAVGSSLRFSQTMKRIQARRVIKSGEWVKARRDERKELGARQKQGNIRNILAMPIHTGTTRVAADRAMTKQVKKEEVGRKTAALVKKNAAECKRVVDTIVISSEILIV